MKRTYVLFILAVGLLTCAPADKNVPSAIRFEINKIIMPQDLPSEIMDRFPEYVITADTAIPSPFIAYFSQGDSSLVPEEITIDSVRLLSTACPLDDPKGYFAFIAVNEEAALSLSDVKKAAPEQNHILLYFNEKGAVKWAALTKEAKGTLIAFAVNHKIYSITAVAGEIRNGIARMDGFKNAEDAKKTALLLNSNLRN